MRNTSWIGVVMLSILASCTPTNNQEQTAIASQVSEKKISSEQELQDKFGEGLYAQMHITEGIVLIKLEMERAPLTTANFVALAEGKMPNDAKQTGEPFFDGLTFHRVISLANGDDNQFMVQGGDPMGTGEGGPGYQFRDEFHPDLRHNVPGILSMANSGPGSNGSQFFITVAPTPHLDQKHSIFGRVVDGFDAVNRTLQGDKIRWVAVVRVGEAAKNFDAVGTFNKLKDGPAND